ncbi:MAG: rhomboid family intramembrane serine protease [Phycisphaerales bacterium]|nr:rhomboid family intramembrane serine protease [Phycisphaerales bacterium]
MGIHDRDYNRTGSGFGAPPTRSQGMLVRSPGWSVNTWVIVINIAIHILAVTILFPTLYNIGSMSVFNGFQRLEVWRLITFQFLHDPSSIWHLGMNMFGLWIFGPMVEEYLGGKKYLAFYLVCGLAGGLLFSILTVLGNVTGASMPGLLTNDYATPLIGASAGVFGVIVACAHIQPNTTIQLLFPPIPMKLKFFAYGYVGLALFQLLAGSSNAGGEAAHLGGAIAGFYFIRNSHHLMDFFDVFDDSRKKNPSAKPNKPRKPKQPRGVPTDDEIDRILAKVNSSGLQSLTDKEKRTLNNASKQQQNRS